MDGSNKKSGIVIITIINFFLFIIMLTVNALANILPINGKSTGELSDKYPNLFVPSGITFSIWGLIYLLLSFFVFYSLYSALAKGDKFTLKLNGYVAFGFTCLLNSFWLLAWHYEHIILSVLIMIALLLCLIYLFLKIDKIKTNSIIQKISIKLPISVYLGWISIATIANITILLVYLKWSGSGIPENIWASLLIFVGALLGISMLLLRKNIPYALVVIWAYIGIIIKRSSQEIIFKDIIYSSYISILLISIFIFITFLKKRQEK